MSANLFGAMCGGLLEYNAMYFGFQFLYWLAAALYAGAFVSSLAARQNARPGRAAGHVIRPPEKGTAPASVDAGAE